MELPLPNRSESLAMTRDFAFGTCGATGGLAKSRIITELLVGASGTLMLSNGLIRVGGVLDVAKNSDSLGRFDVLGGVVAATNAMARIGDEGNGKLSQNAGTVHFDRVSVGRGSHSAGRLNVCGGSMQASSLSLGRFPTAQGTMEVSDRTLGLSTKTLYVGREGTGTAEFSNRVANAESPLIAAREDILGMCERGFAGQTGLAINSTPRQLVQSR
jgi:hypothetical protein